MALAFDDARANPEQSRGMRFSVIVCAHNEAQFLPACLRSLLAQSRTPDEILVVNNASTDSTRAVAEAIQGVRVVDESRKGLVVARETGRLAATGDILVYLDADCRAPVTWLERIERRFIADPLLLALSGPYRFYDWDWWGCVLIRAYDYTHCASLALPSPSTSKEK
jgi:glycosyltransferase involved in cell wall biosynthesis